MPLLWKTNNRRELLVERLQNVSKTTVDFSKLQITSVEGQAVVKRQGIKHLNQKSRVISQLEETHF